METVEQMIFVGLKLDELVEHRGLAVGHHHQGQAESLVNLPCRERKLLSRFLNAPAMMLDEVKGLNHYETQSDKLARKLRESPFFGIGLLAMVGVCTVGALRFRQGSVTLPMPQYLMQLRVAAQSACVGSVVAGTAYTMVTQHQNHSDE